jgi:hypothetical protein
VPVPREKPRRTASPLEGVSYRFGTGMKGRATTVKKPKTHPQKTRMGHPETQERWHKSQRYNGGSGVVLVGLKSVCEN